MPAAVTQGQLTPLGGRVKPQRDVFAILCTHDGLDHAPCVVLFFNGGMGTTPQKDGEHVLSWPSSTASTPVEVAERHGPLFLHHNTENQPRPPVGFLRNVFTR